MASASIVWWRCSTGAPGPSPRTSSPTATSKSMTPRSHSGPSASLSGMRIVFEPTVVEAETLDPDPSVDFEVVHADDHVIVVNKPAGLVVHPGAGRPDGTLVNGLLAHFPENRQMLVRMVVLASSTASMARRVACWSLHAQPRPTRCSRPPWLATTSSASMPPLLAVW